MPNEAGTVEILEAIQTVAESVQSLATHMDQRFNEHGRRFESIEARMATKEDLKDFATKDDLQEIRDDLQRFATKEDLKSFAANVDLQFFAIKEDMKGFAKKEDLQEFKEEIISHVDWFATQHNRYDTELLSLRSSTLRHEERITNLEQRHV